MTENYVDTNIVLEIFSQEIDENQREKIKSILQEGGIISIQVLNEMVSVTMRWAGQGKNGWTRDKVKAFSDYIRSILTVVPLTEAIHTLALDISAEHKLSWWDSLQLAAAVKNGCPVFWSKDMHHGLLVRGVTRIQNPYK